MNESQPIPAAVRPVTEDDWAALRTARLAALAEAPYAFSSTIAREQELSEGAWRARIRDSATFAAWQGEVIVGTVTGLSRADPSLWNLVAMWVSPDWRGTGIADDLVSAVCERAHVRRRADRPVGNRHQRPRPCLLRPARVRADR
jgi:GNAT superfamily N-acetyltransferase